MFSQYGWISTCKIVKSSTKPAGGGRFRTLRHQKSPLTTDCCWSQEPRRSLRVGAAARADSRHSLNSNCPVRAKRGENKPFPGAEELLPLSNFSGQTTIFGGFRYDQATPQVKEGKPRSASCQCEDSQGKAQEGSHLIELLPAALELLRLPTRWGNFDIQHWEATKKILNRASLSRLWSSQRCLYAN